MSPLPQDYPAPEPPPQPNGGTLPPRTSSDGPLPRTSGDGPPLRADAQRNRARVLDAAEAVFAERGASASTEEVARRAGVAIGTVFRHFPTKGDLLAAIMKRLLAHLIAEAGDRGGPTGLFEFFEHLVAQAAGKRAVVELLAQAGIQIQIPDATAHLEQAVGTLLAQAQSAGTVRPDVQLPEVMALLISVTQGALHGGWPPDLRTRTLNVIFTGLRP